jgi:hypothetical protein
LNWHNGGARRSRDERGSNQPAGRRAVCGDDAGELWLGRDSGGTGTMTLRWRGDLVEELTVAFT